LSRIWRRSLTAVIATAAVVVPVGIVAGAASALNVSPVVINEVESNGDATDWIELKNTGASAVDISGWIVKDDNDTRTLAVPASTTIAPGGYYTIDTDVSGTPGNFGLGQPDKARIYNGSTLIDSYAWTTHAATSYGRNPDGTGAFTTTSASTKNAANTFTASTAVTWPGGTAVATVDNAGLVTENLSGLDYEASGTSAPGTVWAVINGPGTLHKLVKSGGKWVPTAGDFAAGKALKYTDGTGNPDSEGVTFTDAGSAAGIYVSTERNNDASSTSRPAILKFMPETSGSTLTATMDWNLTADLPTVGANLGLEAITWIPDTFLVAQGLWDESANALYNPATYVNHGSGLFFAGLEANGSVYAYALKNDGTYVRVATFASGFPSIMDLQFDAETSHLWAQCDNTCSNKLAILDIAQSGPTDGRFGVTTVYSPPADLPTTMNNEGFAIAPNAECVNNAKPVLWADDGDTGTFSLRQGTINCPTLTSTPTPTATPTPTPTPTSTPAPTPAQSTTPVVTPPVQTPAVVVPKIFTKKGKATITGAVKVGKKLTVKVSAFSPKPKLTYRWYANGKAISKATKSTYTVTKSVKGKKLTVKVTATLSGYTTLVVTSKASTKVK